LLVLLKTWDVTESKEGGGIASLKKQSEVKFRKEEAYHGT
jgi:hypothetical protein